MKTRVDSITPSGGNAFADLGLPDAEERKIKVQLAVAINAQITRRRLTQLQAAERLGINQPKVSALLNYKLSGFSVELESRFQRSDRRPAPRPL